MATHTWAHMTRECSNTDTGNTYRSMNRYVYLYNVHEHECAASAEWLIFSVYSFLCRLIATHTPLRWAHVVEYCRAKFGSLWLEMPRECNSSGIWYTHSRNHKRVYSIRKQHSRREISVARARTPVHNIMHLFRCTHMNSTTIYSSRLQTLVYNWCSLWQLFVGSAVCGADDCSQMHDASATHITDQISKTRRRLRSLQRLRHHNSTICIWLKTPCTHPYGFHIRTRIDGVIVAHSCRACDTHLTQIPICWISVVVCPFWTYSTYACA